MYRPNQLICFVLLLQAPKRKPAPAPAAAGVRKVRTPPLVFQWVIMMKLAQV